MREPATVPELVVALAGQAPALQLVDEDRFQAHCQGCLRSSPIVRGDIIDALICVDDLGWTTVGASRWKCPLCCSPESGRYALP